MNVSSCGPLAMKVAKDMLLADPMINKILLVGAPKESTVVDYQNERSRFMYNFGDGGAAVLLTKNINKNQLLEAATITDGSFHDCVMVPVGGTVMPVSMETIREGTHYIDVVNPQNMKARLDPVTLPNFLQVIEGSVHKSGYNMGDINFVAPWHTKRSMFKQLLSSLGLAEENTFYLEERGHMSAIDLFVVLEEGFRKGRVKDQDLVVLVSAGTGYTWSAISIRWGGNA
jgi:3-oxoacyl-[acyl-carrier-protein] synthase-3